VSNDELRDQLPDDLNVAAFSGPYEFPDNSRRRIPGYLYIGIAIACLIFRAFGPTDSALMSKGWVGAAILLGAFGLLSISSGWRMTVDEKHALVLATRAIGFPVGHASAQQVWRGLRSRPTWRVFCYSAEEPPMRRGLVLVDAINGSVVEKLTEANPDFPESAK
jgi:hypothetical protein